MFHKNRITRSVTTEGKHPYQYEKIVKENAGYFKNRQIVTDKQEKK